MSLERSEPTRAERLMQLPRGSMYPRNGRWRRLPLAVLAGIGGPALVTAGMSVFQPVPLRIAVLVYLLPVLFASLVVGIAAALLAAVTSFLAILYFDEPRGLFTVATTEGGASVGLYFVVAVSVALTLRREQRTRAISEVMQHRLSFLAGANDVMSRASLDRDRTLHDLAHVSVPGLADWCVVDLLEDDGSHHIVVAGAERFALVQNMAYRSPPRTDADRGAGAVLRTGRSELYRTVSDEERSRLAHDPHHAAILHGLGLRSLMIVPIRNRRGIVGTIEFGSSRRDRAYGTNDLALAEDLAQRAGTALENVGLYVDRTRTVEILQSGLLPHELPAIPGAELEARFTPGREGELVGGDFYDAFETPDGWWLVVGDVCGKGAEAAAVTGLVRHAIRTAALLGRSPADVLAIGNDALIRSGGDRFCTAATALATPHAGGYRLRIASGGHPPPLVVCADGRTTVVKETGPLLGVFPDIEVSETRMDLRPGDAAVFYTDGLLDELDAEPEQRLVTVLTGLHPAPAKRLADALQELAGTRRAPMDDSALLVLRVLPAGEA